MRNAILPPGEPYNRTTAADGRQVDPGWLPGPLVLWDRGVGERVVSSLPGSKRVLAAPLMSESGVPTASGSLLVQSMRDNRPCMVSNRA